jgi:hypothetical protein
MKAIHATMLPFTVAAAWAHQAEQLRGTPKRRQAQQVGRVTGLRLIDTDTYSTILQVDSPVGENVVLDLATMSAGHNLSIEAIVDNAGGAVGSVQFGYTGTRNNFRIENEAPWSMCGNVGNDFARCDDLVVGFYRISVNPYAGKDATGSAGASVSLALTIINSVSPFSPTTLTLIDATTDTDLGPFTDGAIIKVAQTPSVNVRADPDPSFPTGSVQFTYDGLVFRNENIAPYAFGGNVGAEFDPWTPPSPGSHTIVATPYSEKDAQGTAGNSVSVTFLVQD